MHKASNERQGLDGEVTTSASDTLKAEAERRIVIAVAKMTKRQRAIFLAVRYEGAGYQELAERHGITTDAVERALAGAMLMIRRCRAARYPQLVWPWRWR